METFADYILAEKDYGRKIEIMHYLLFCIHKEALL